MSDSPEMNTPLKLVDSQYESVEAETVDIQTSAVRHISAQQVTMRESIAIAVQAPSAAVKRSGIAALQGEVVQVEESVVNLLSANSVQLNNSKVGAVSAKELRAGKLSSVVTIAGKIDGNVETILDQRTLALVALLAGAAFGAVVGIFSLLKKDR